MTDYRGRRTLGDGLAPDWRDDSPPDTPEEHRLVACPCKAERVYGQSCWSCGNPPRRSER